MLLLIGLLIGGPLCCRAACIANGRFRDGLDHSMSQMDFRLDPQKGAHGSSEKGWSVRRSYTDHFSLPSSSYLPYSSL